MLPDRLETNSFSVRASIVSECVATAVLSNAAAAVVGSSELKTGKFRDIDGGPCRCDTQCEIVRVPVTVCLRRGGEGLKNRLDRLEGYDPAAVSLLAQTCAELADIGADVQHHI